MLNQILLAQATNDLSTQIGQVLNLLMEFGFLFGVIIIIAGALAIRRGDSEMGKMGIVAGAIIAAAPAIMRLLYHVFGLDSAVAIFK